MSGRLARLQLTRRERALAQLILAGCTNQEIADRCGIRVKTVKNQLTTLYEKTGVSNRLQLAVFAMDHRELIK